MKKILTISILLHICFTAFSQEKFFRTSKAKVKMPIVAQKLTQQELADYVKSNFKDSAIPTDAENVYKINNILLSYWDWPVNTGEPKRTLEERKNLTLVSYNSFNKKHGNLFKDIEANIITVNNIKYLIDKHSYNNDVYIWFFSEDRKINSLLGLVQFTKGNEAQANQVLNDFLKSVNIDNY
jgi:hypothetical protein